MLAQIIHEYIHENIKTNDIAVTVIINKKFILIEPDILNYIVSVLLTIDCLVTLTEMKVQFVTRSGLVVKSKI